MTAGCPPFGEIGVVDQTDLLEPIEDPLGDVVGDALAGQRLPELGTGPRPGVEAGQGCLPGVLVPFLGGALDGLLRGAAASAPAVLAAPRPAAQNITSPVFGSTSAGTSSSVSRPIRIRIFDSISAATSVFSLRNLRTFSLPWPSCSVSL